MPVETLKGHMGERKANFLPETINLDKRTIDVCWSTGATVTRYSWSGRINESLSMESSAVDLKRLNAGAALLDTHKSWDLRSQIGVVEKAWLKDGKGYATVRFSSRDEVEAIFKDVQDGIIRNLSVGYKVHKYKELKRSEDDTKNYLAVRWEPMEISFVPVPADAGSQVRSQRNTVEFPVEIERINEMPKRAAKPDDNEDKKPTPPEEPKNTPPVDSGRSDPETPEPDFNPDQIRTEARKLVNDINALCDKHSVPPELRSELVENAGTLDEASLKVLEHLEKRSDEEATKNPYNIQLGRNEMDVRREAIVPDLQDRFPRVVADEEKLGKTQEQSTNKGDLNVGISEFSAGTVSIKESLKVNSEPSNADIKMFCDTRPPARGLGGDWHFYGGANSAIKARVKKPNSNEYYDGEHNLIGADPNEGIPMGHGGQQIFKDVGHKHEVKLTLDKTFPVEGASCSAELSGGDNETRPKACYINAFIRVS